MHGDVTKEWSFTIYHSVGARGTRNKVIVKKFKGKRKEQLFYQCMAKPGTGYHRTQVSDMFTNEFKGLGKVMKVV